MKAGINFIHWESEIIINSFEASIQIVLIGTESH